MITCEGLVKIYRASGIEVFALQGLDLRVAQGEMVAIVGNSGSGKSTLLNILGGLDHPSAGSAQVADWDLTKLTDRQRDAYRRRVAGFVWQNSGLNLIPYLSAQENLLLAMQIAGVKPDQAEARRLLDLVGVGDRQAALPSQMSGGEQQRVAVAVALAHKPPLLLADEPTGALDASSGQMVLEALQRVNGELGTTILLVTHDMGVAALAGRSVRIRDGKVSTEALRGEGEMVILDTAGRLQVPRKILDAAGIGRRATVTLRGRTVLLRSPDENPSTR